jgi:hypothetical protein
MAQKSLELAGHPNIEGGAKYGLRYLSFIKSDTAFATSAGLSGTAVEGQLRYDSSEHNFKFWNGTADTAVASAAAAGTGLDNAYDINPGITVDGTSLTLTGSNADVLTVVQTANNDGIYISKTGTGSGAALNILNVGTGADIYTTGGYFQVSKAGAITGLDLTLTSSTVSITGDATSGVIVAIEADTLTTGTGLEIDADGGANVKALDIQNGSTSVFLVGGTGIVTLAGVASGTSTMVFTAGDLELTAGDINITAGDIALTTGLYSQVTDGSADGFTLTDLDGQNYDLMYLNGTDQTGSGSILKIDQGASTRTGHMVDLNMGTTAVAMSAIDITCTGGTRTVPIISIDSDGTAEDMIYCHTDVAFSGNMIQLDVATGAATGNFIFIDNATGTSMEAINIDDEANVEDIILISATANTGAGNALINLVADGTPNATANALLINWTGITATNTPYAQKIDCSAVDAGALSIDSDATTDDCVLINGGGAITNGNAVLAITNDGNLATGGNLFSIDVGGTPHAAAIAFELQSAKNCQAMFVNTAAATDSAIEITGTGAVADNKALLELNWTSTPAAAGSNMLRVDGSGGTNTAKPVLVEIYDNSVAVGLSVSTASIEDMVTFIGTGATGAAKAVVDITSTALMNATSNLLRLDLTGADTTSVPTALEVVGTGETARGIYVDTDGTTVGAAAFHSGGALTNGVGVVNITNDGNLATGGNLLNVTVGGTPHTAAAAVEIVSAKDCYALDITTSAATNSAVQITGVGAIANDKALLSVVHGTGAIVAGGSIVRIAGDANAGGATAYGLTINCNATNLEALWVEAGTVLVAETLVATGGLSTKLGTTADLTATTPTDAEFSTAFGVANKTRGAFFGFVEDSSDGKLYLVASDGTTWHFAAMTAAGA